MLPPLRPCQNIFGVATMVQFQVVCPGNKGDVVNGVRSFFFPIVPTFFVFVVVRMHFLEDFFYYFFLFFFLFFLLSHFSFFCVFSFLFSFFCIFLCNIGGEIWRVAAAFFVEKYR